MKKDGIDKYPTVDAKDWREAMELAGPGVCYRCADGTLVTFGTQAVKLKLTR